MRQGMWSSAANSSAVTLLRSSKNCCRASWASKPVQRPNTWLHRPALHVKKTLASREPSTHGTTRKCRMALRISAHGRGSELAGFPFQLDTSILVRDVAGEGSDGGRHVPERLSSRHNASPRMAPAMRG